MCYLDASGLQCDRKTGWFAANPADGTNATPVFRIIGQEFGRQAAGCPDREETLQSTRGQPKVNPARW